MGTPTNEFLRIAKNTKKGFEYYGCCDQCGKHCSEHWVSMSKRVWVREDGTRYLGHDGAGAFGHLSCLIKNFGDHIAQSSLVRHGNIYLYPDILEDKNKNISDNNIILYSTEEDPLADCFSQ